MAIAASPDGAARDDLAGAPLEFPDNRLLIDLCGEYDRNLTRIEHELGVNIVHRGNQLAVIGAKEARDEAESVLKALYARLESGRPVGAADIDSVLRLAPRADGTGGAIPWPEGAVELHTRKKPVEPRTPNQRRYVSSLFASELTFGLGPAGTGKTYLAVAAAVTMFLAGAVERIILSRPAVEAGERLGFLPGDMKEKIDPYMQPLYDALNDFLPARQLERLVADRRIEIAPLAFMRGRTLGNAFVVLDEAQNATSMQMKMFLTRLGEGSRMAITGDPTQTDLPRGQKSGLIEARHILREVDGVSFVFFDTADVVRHALVARIIRAYAEAGLDER